MAHGEKVEKDTITFKLFCLHTSELLVFSIAMELLLAAILFAIGYCITWILLPLSFSIAIILTYIMDNRKKNSIQNVVEVVFVVAAFLLVVYCSGKTYDVSWDGNAYHKIAVGLLKDKWNPLSIRPEEFRMEGAKCQPYVECYCKGSWIFSASILQMSTTFLHGKVRTFLHYPVSSLLHSSVISFLHHSVRTFLHPYGKQIFTFISFLRISQGA